MWRVIQADQHAASLVKNGDFEQLPDGKLADWRGEPKGFTVAPQQGRKGSTALLCSKAASEGSCGASQTIRLDQSRPTPLYIRGWSKAKAVDGGEDSGYSLYVDIVYTDGTPLWGQTGNFRCGTHDWEPREWVIFPQKPVRSLTLYALFRNHAGTVWFDDLEAGEIRVDQQAVLFQGAPVQLTNAAPASAVNPQTYATQDGLKISLADSRVTAWQAGGVAEQATAPSGFLARDVAAQSDVYEFTGGNCPELGLKIESEIETRPDHLAIHGKLTDTTGKDRAITLVFALPVAAAGWIWGDDPRRQRPVEGAADYAHLVNIECGADGLMSLYPLGAIWNERAGIAIGIDQAQPAQWRLGCHAGVKQLYLAYDFGLAPETAKFPSGAEFRFVLYRFDPRAGFRAALQKYMEIFPEHYRVRSTQQGIWMPFTDVSTVQGWEDFGFRYHEGNNQVPWDDAHGVLSFRYTEPMTWWMPMEKSVPRTPAAARAARDALANGPHSPPMAQVTRAAAMQNADGEPALQFQNTPWCNGAVWSINPNPWLPAEPNGATVYWSPASQEQLYGAAAQGKLDGEYLDSLEGYVTANLNFCRDHFRYTTVPLTFSLDTRKPALFKGLAVAEFTRWMAEAVHRRNLLMFANGVPYRFTFLCPWLDVLGTETDWLVNGKYRPAADETMCLWRAMSGAKPYLLLMNTDFEAFGPSVEKYFQRALFYGMWPSMFSHNAADNPYWQKPAWYNRDRPLFQKYLPLIRRVAEAGWQPVTGARVDNPGIHAERFGPDARGAVFFTLLNDTEQAQTGRLTMEFSAAPKEAGLLDSISGREITGGPGGWALALAPQQALLLEFVKK